MIDRSVGLAALLGVANVAAVFAAAFVLRSISWNADVLVVAGVLGVSALSTFALGAGPTYALLRYRLVLPLLASGRMTYLAVVDRGAIHSFVEVFLISPFVLVAVAVVAIVGVLEYGVRDRLGVFPPEPLW